jgi:hypothetical protein
MKRITSISIICLYIFLNFPLNTFAFESPYTILIYLNGSDLESSFNSSAASDDLKEMLSLNSNQKINIVIKTGGTLKWKTSNISNANNQTWQIKNNKLNLLKTDKKNTSMGNPNTLSEFINWSINKFPSKKYALILWNHGGGAVNGFGFDEFFPSDPSLTLYELNKALKNSFELTNKKFEFIGFDACLMSTIEVADSIDNYSKYMIASEELEPNHGWNYTEFLNQLNNNPDLNTTELGKIICDSYKEQSKDYIINENITLSVIDLSKINSLIKSFENLISQIDSDIKTTSKFYNLLKARSKNYDFGSSNREKSNMIDLGELLENLSLYYPIKTKLIKDNLNQSVVYKISNDISKESNGLSIYFPYKDKDKFKEKLALYNNNNFSKIYKSFLQKYTDLMLNLPQTIDMEKITTEIENDSQENYIETKLNKEILNKLNSIYSFIGKKEDSKIIYYGTNYDTLVNKSTGKIQYTFKKKWFKLNNTLISMYITNNTDEYLEYSIPALLNNKEVNIKVIFNDDYPNGKISGVWQGINKISGMSYKEISSLSFGDELIPLFYFEDKASNTSGYIKGEKIIVENLDLTYDYIDSGNYLYGFYIIDLMQNEEYYISNEITLISPKDDDLKIYLNNKKVNFEFKPFINNSRTMVPLRKIFELLNLEVVWNENKTIECYSKNNTKILLSINSNIAYKNDLKIKLDSPVILKNSKTYVPLRFISESTGIKVEWDENSKSIFLISNF